MTRFKAGLLNRAVATMIDLIIVGAGSALPEIGFTASLFYIAVRDGFSGGQSPGKRLAGLRTVSLDPERTMSFRESIIRNLPFIAARMFWQLPVLGWLIAGFILLFESLLVVGSPLGCRLGDELAHTQVVEEG